MRTFVVMLLVVVFSTVAHANLLLNADFESGTLGQFTAGAVVNNWTIFGSDSGWYQTDIDAQRSVTMWSDSCGIYQDWAATAGDAYLLTVDARHPSVEPLSNWHAYLKVEWYNGSWLKLGETELDYLSSADSQNAWIELSGIATAAAGSVNGRIVLGLNNYINPSSGKAYFDNASVVAAIPEPTLVALIAVGLGVVRILRRRS